MDPAEPEPDYVRMMREGAERSERAIEVSRLQYEGDMRLMAAQKARFLALCDRLHAKNRELLAIMARIEAKWAAEGAERKRSRPPV
jgi:hypothetical protein